MRLAAGPSCPACGTAMASDQEYCLDCGTRRDSLDLGSMAPLLVAAAIALIVAVALLVDLAT